jgi:hypothetical protein
MRAPSASLTAKFMQKGAKAVPRLSSERSARMFHGICRGRHEESIRKPCLRGRTSHVVPSVSVAFKRTVNIRAGLCLFAGSLRMEGHCPEFGRSWPNS